MRSDSKPVQLGSVVMVLLLSACAVGPDYKRPKLTPPEIWSTPPAAQLTTEAAALAKWWEGFGDPTLNQLIEQALLANLDLKIAVARVKEARAMAAVAGADLWPDIGVGGSYTRSRTSENVSFGAAASSGSSAPLMTGNLFQVGFDAGWEIDIFGGRRRGKEAVVARAEEADETRRNVLVTVAADVARTYIELCSLQRQLDVAGQNLKAQEEALRITEIRMKNQITSELDVMQARSIVATTRAEVPQLEAFMAHSSHKLSVLLGQPPGKLEASLFTEAAIPPVPPSVPVGLPSDLLKRRPDIRAAERNLAASTAQIGVAKSDLFPKFFLTGGIGLQSSDSGNLLKAASRYYSFGPSIRWPLFQAGALRAQVRVENARQEQALLKYEAVILKSLEETENAMVSLEKEQLRWNALTQAVEASRKAFELANSRYLNGLSDFLVVASAEQSLYFAEKDLTRSQQSVSTHLIALYKALGGGWEWELGEKQVGALP